MPWPGQLINNQGGTLDVDSTRSRLAWVPGVAEAGETITLELEGESGDTVWFFRVLSAGQPFSTMGLNVHLDPATLKFLFGVAMPSFKTTLDVLIPQLPVGFDVVQVPLQVFFIDTAGVFRESGPSLLVVH